MLVACEGRGAHEPGKRKGEFDAQVYRALFADEFPDVEFISLGGSSEVEKNAAIVSVVLGRLMENTKIIRFIDRDDRDEAEVQALAREGVRVLPRRHIESYLFDDSVLAALCQNVGKEQLSGQIIAEKANLLNVARQAGKPPDDVKSIAGQLYVAIKRELALTQCGNTVEAFSLRNLAPILRDTPTLYSEIKGAMFAPMAGIATPR